MHLGTLPEWNLGDFYSSITAPEIETDFTKAEQVSRDFAAKYTGKLASLDGKALSKAIEEFEALSEILGKLGSYAQLLYTKDMSNPDNTRFYQNTSERITDISTLTLFFTLELNKLSSVPDVGRYQPWVRDVRAFRPYQLSDELEELLHEKSITGQQAWQRLFDETLAGLKFPYKDKQLNSSEIFDLLSSPDGKVRQEAAYVISDVLKANGNTFAMITNVLAKDKAIEDDWRKFPHPISSRNLSNYIEDEVVEALVNTVKANYNRLSHRYYDLKAKWLGMDRLNYWDRNAPLPDDDDRRIPWEEAKELVLSAYNDFSPTLAGIAKDFFDKRWIDAVVTEGKDSGAFSHPTVPSVHPYILMNYQGKTRDVMTLAHELGHGVHQVLSAKQGGLMADTPLTLAETASVFGEQLTFRKLLAQQPDEKKRKAMIASKVEDMLNTVVRQIAFCEFERMVHDERKQGEVPLERIGEIWMKVQRESLGPAITFEESYNIYWSYIPHFIHSPFYVYAYAFGDCLVNSLYAAYQNKPEGFESKYLEMLKAGGTLRHKELLAPFGLDASKPDFWKQGIDIISGFIDQLE